MRLLIQIFLCIFVTCIFMYRFVHKQNELTALRLEIPPLAAAVSKIEGENGRLQYEIDRFENPIHLMELARKPEYKHLKYPLVKDIIILPVGDDPIP